MRDTLGKGPHWRNAVTVGTWLAALPLTLPRALSPVDCEAAFLHSMLRPQVLSLRPQAHSTRASWPWIKPPEP